MTTPAPASPWKTLALSFVIAVLFWIADPGPYALWLSVVSWAAICVASESFWHRAPDDTNAVSMAPAAEVGALLALPHLWGFVVVVASRLIGLCLWRRERLPRIILETGAVTLATSVAILTFHLLEKPLSPSNLAGDPKCFITVALAGALFIATEQAFLSYWTARHNQTTFGHAWRDAFGKATGLMTSGALLTVAALVVFGSQTLGVRGVLLAAMPALFVRDGSRRNIDLERAQTQLINNERLAAKGEMAAEIGHELNNYLAAISGRAQLLLRKIDEESKGPASAEAERIRQLANQMADLARGLMEFSHRDVKRTAVGINELVEKTIEFVKPQMKFREFQFNIESDPTLPRVEIDPGQIQQVLLVLLGKTAECGTSSGSTGLDVRTFVTPDRLVAIDIGLSDMRLMRSLEPEEEEAALDTVRRILDRHHGRLQGPDDEYTDGYRIFLPAA